MTFGANYGRKNGRVFVVWLHRLVQGRDVGRKISGGRNNVERRNRVGGGCFVVQVMGCGGLCEEWW